MLAFFKKAFFTEQRTVIGLFILITLGGFTKYFIHMDFHHLSNLCIYEGSFPHFLEQLNLYQKYDGLDDYFLYGPLFALLIAPFTLLPKFIGSLLWLSSLSGFLFYAIQRIPIPRKGRAIICWIVAQEVLTGLFSQQFNIAIAAIIVLAYLLVEEEKDVWATFFIALGMFVKLYSCVGLVFFLFSKHKKKFVGSFLFWGVLFFVLPMVFSSPQYVLDQYVNWYHVLLMKNELNLHSLNQNVSLLGMVSRIDLFGEPSNLYLIIPGLLLFASPLLRFKEYKEPRFRLLTLASTLIFIILFSTGSESSGIIIPQVGIAIWYVTKERKTNLDHFLVLFSIFFPPNFNICPHFINEFITYHKFRALPCFLVWIQILYELLTYRFKERAMVLAPEEEL